MLASSSFAVLISAATAMASTHQARSHNVIAKRIDNSTFTVDKRGDQYVNKQFTWYPTDTGTDACTGKNHQDSDFFVAMAQPQFGDGSACCGKKLSITVNGKTAIASCVDECVANSEQCYEAGQLDFTKGLFEYFTGGDLDVGTIYGSWSYTDGNDGPSSGSGGSSGSSGSGGDGGDSGDGGDDTPTTTTHHTTTTTTTHQTTPTTHPTSSSVKSSSSAKPSSSVKASSSAKPSSSSIYPSPSAQPSSTTAVKSASSAAPSGGVANAGSGSGSSGDSAGIDKISGGLGTGSGDSSNAASLSSNKIIAAVGFVAVVVAHAL